MASNDIEVLDPAATVEKLKKITSGVALNRRQFMGALGVAGVAAGTGLVSSTAAHAQQPIPDGYQQVDILNLLLNMKYLTSTFYSYVTRAADLPATTYATLSTGQIYNIPLTAVAFANQQQTDLFNEMYYDELNQVIDLRNLITGSLTLETSPVVARPTLCLGGQASTTATQAYTGAQAIAQARMLEDLCVTAFAYSLTYLSGSYLSVASQSLAISGQHAAALRLLTIQNPTTVSYQRTQLATTTQIGTTAGSTAVIAIGTLSTNILVGANVVGTGIPAGAVLTALTSKSAATFSAVVASGSNLLVNASSVALAAVGQPVTGTGIPANTVMTAVGTTTITMSAPATASSTATAVTVSGSNVLNTVSTSAGVVGEPISGTGIPANTTITATGTNSLGNTITMSANATTSSVATAATGNLTAGSNTITNVSSIAGMVTGQPITATGIPAGTTIVATGSNSITGIVTSGSKTISNVSSIAGLVNGQAITGTGIASGATVSSSSGTTITMSAAGTANSTVSLTGIVTSGSTNITGVSSLGGILNGQTITSGTGIPTGTTVVSSSGTTIVMSAKATANSTTTVTGILASGSTSITAVSSLSAVLNGQGITGTNIPTGTTVVSSSGSTIIMSNAATGPSTATVTGQLTSGSVYITGVPSISSVLVGQTLSGAGIAAGATVVSTTAETTDNVITMSAAASASTTVTVTGNTTNGSTSITGVSSLTGVSNGQTITGNGIPTGTSVVSSSGTTIVVSNPITATASAQSFVIDSTETITLTSATETITLVGAAETIAITGAEALTTAPYAINISNNATATASNVPLTTPTTITITTPTAETVTTGQSILTISLPATATASSTGTFIVSDPLDLAPADPATIPATVTATSATVSIASVVGQAVGQGVTGLVVGQTVTGPGIPAGTTITAVTPTSVTLSAVPTAAGTSITVPALAAAGPGPSPSLVPEAIQGFFNTAGANTSNGATPPGFAFTRTFSQVLGVLYANVTPATAKGGFFDVGVNGKINAV